jgi:hypothetical protein
MNVILKHIRQRLAPQSFPDTAEDLAKNDVLIRVVVIQYRNLTSLSSRGTIPIVSNRLAESSL